MLLLSLVKAALISCVALWMSCCRLLEKSQISNHISLQLCGFHITTLLLLIKMAAACISSYLFSICEQVRAMWNCDCEIKDELSGNRLDCSFSHFTTTTGVNGTVCTEFSFWFHIPLTCKHEAWVCFFETGVWKLFHLLCESDQYN